MSELLAISRKLSQRVQDLSFSAPVAHVYNPLSYANDSWGQYCRRYGEGQKRYLWLGMNPGPFGMAQTGVPFGEIEAVSGWLDLRGKVTRPPHEHPKRPVLGFDCPRSEVSGRRLWGYIKARWQTPQRFFKSSFVYNFCPLLFVHETGKNITPDKLPAAESKPLYAHCDEALIQSAKALKVEAIVAVGAFALTRAKRALGDLDLELYRVPHPSPASPLANRGWSAAAQNALDEQGLYTDVPAVTKS